MLPPRSSSIDISNLARTHQTSEFPHTHIYLPILILPQSYFSVWQHSHSCSSQKLVLNSSFSSYFSSNSLSGGMSSTFKIHLSSDYVSPPAWPPSCYTPSSYLPGFSRKNSTVDLLSPHGHSSVLSSFCLRTMSVLQL